MYMYNSYVYIHNFMIKFNNIISAIVIPATCVNAFAAFEVNAPFAHGRQYMQLLSPLRCKFHFKEDKLKV